MKKITVFDFDGTLTLKDSMMAIIVYQRGRMGLLWALLREIHLVVLMFMHLYSNQKTKECLLAYCFGGMTLEEFDNFCKRFADSHRHILAPSMKNVMQKAKDENNTVYVITASPVNWVSRFVEGVTVIGSHMECVDGRVTGKLKGKNCYGPEKVNRLLDAVPDLKEHRSEYYVTAYGDSRGDKEMLAFADEGHLVKNRE